MAPSLLTHGARQLGQLQGPGASVPYTAQRRSQYVCFARQAMPRHARQQPICRHVCRVGTSQSCCPPCKASVEGAPRLAGQRQVAPQRLIQPGQLNYGRTGQHGVRPGPVRHVGQQHELHGCAVVEQLEPAGRADTHEAAPLAGARRPRRSVTKLARSGSLDMKTIYEGMHGIRPQG